MSMKKFIDKNFNSSKRRITEQGYLIAPAYLARIGTMDYLGEEIDPKGELRLDKGKTYKVNRLPDDVFSQDAIESFEGMPITITHPEDDVTAENWKQLTVGFVKNVHQEGEFLAAEAWVTDRSAIDLIEKDGVKELSCGYTSKLVEDDTFDFKQINIVGNHVALVPEGRAGNAKLLDKKGNKMAKKQTKPNGLIRRLLDSIGIKLTDEQLEKVEELDEEITENKDDDIEAGEQPEPEEKIDPQIVTVDNGSPENKDGETENKGSETENKDEGADEAEALKTQLAAAQQEVRDLKDQMEMKDEAEQVARDAVRFVPGLQIKVKDSARAIRIKALETINPSYKGRLLKMKDAAIESLYIQETSKQGEKMGGILLKDSAVKKTDYNALYRGK